MQPADEQTLNLLGIRILPDLCVAWLGELGQLKTSVANILFHASVLHPSLMDSIFGAFNGEKGTIHCTRS